MLSPVHLPPRVSYGGHLTSAFRVPRSSGTREPRAGSRISCSYWNMRMKSHVNIYLISSRMYNENINDLLQNCSNSIAYALELLLSCTKPSISYHSWTWNGTCKAYQAIVRSFMSIRNCLMNSSHLDIRPPFRRRYFQMHLREWKFYILIKISLKFVSKGPVGNNQALV